MPSGFFCFLKVNFSTFEMLPLLAIGATYVACFLLASTDVAHVQWVFALTAFFSWNFRADHDSKWKICGEINITKWTTTLSLQDMFRSIINHLQLQMFVTVRIWIYVNITSWTYANTLPFELEITVRRYNSTKYKQSNNARANSVPKEKQTIALNRRKLQQQHHNLQKSNIKT